MLKHFFVQCVCFYTCSKITDTHFKVGLLVGEVCIYIGKELQKLCANILCAFSVTVREKLYAVSL